MRILILSREDGEGSPATAAERKFAEDPSLRSG
jgi:hypothetical protein